MILVHLVSCINWHCLLQARTDGIMNVQQQKLQLQLLQLLMLLLRFATSQLLEIFQTALLLRASEYILLQLLS